MRATTSSSERSAPGHAESRALERDAHRGERAPAPGAVLGTEGAARAEPRDGEGELEPLPLLERQHQVDLLTEVAIAAGQLGLQARVREQNGRLDLPVGVVDEIEGARAEQRETDPHREHAEVRELGIEQHAVAGKALDAAEAGPVVLDPGLPERVVCARLPLAVTGA